jgi:hypothetical protein
MPQNPIEDTYFPSPGRGLRGGLKNSSNNLGLRETSTPEFSTPSQLSMRVDATYWISFSWFFTSPHPNPLPKGEGDATFAFSPYLL